MSNLFDFTFFGTLTDTTDDKPLRFNPKKSYNSISEIRKLNKQRFSPQRQADEPDGGVTNGNIDGDDGEGDVDEHRDPLEVIKEKMRNTAPKSVSCIYHPTQLKIVNPRSINLADEYTDLNISLFLCSISECMQLRSFCVALRCAVHPVPHIASNTTSIHP